MNTARNTSDLAFTWAAFGAAESFLHGLWRHSGGAESCASYILDFIDVGGLKLPARYFIDKTVDLYPWLAPYHGQALRTLDRLQSERGGQ